MMYVCVCVCVCVCVRVCWTVARQASLSMGFSSQEYWSGLLVPPPGMIYPNTNQKFLKRERDSMKLLLCIKISSHYIPHHILIV